jgi:hypothetical protein
MGSRLPMKRPHKTPPRRKPPSTIARSVRKLHGTLNFALPKSVRLVNRVIVLTADLASGSDYIRYFPDAGCLDMSSTLWIKRARLSHPVDLGSRPDCENHIPFEVTQCDVD